MLEDGVIKALETPFLLITTSERNDFVQEATELFVQGYFIKHPSYAKMAADIQLICDYWALTWHTLV
ncbi:hypothetical protein [Chitinophaga rhizophila]|uniref:Response regulatory domain-containing protein n=1 Tax=Chitinophaga rhizophila TaxID=2866212 RepID=A0ABS7GHV8_9BACT|nr:hypothetical protein [Chitinophaga rhizophila]MBW8687277.1 hypothetical protein [Chitinophaga rhizophila]